MCAWGACGRSSILLSPTKLNFFQIADHSRLFENLGEFVCSLRPAEARLCLYFSLYFWIKSKGGRKSNRTFLSSRRRFVGAKRPEQKRPYLVRLVENFYPDRRTDRSTLHFQKLKSRKRTCTVCSRRRFR